MAELSKTPGSSTVRQRQILHQLKRRHGWSDDELHDACGVASVKDLSAAKASELISRLGGGELANPPGEKPGPYAGKPKSKGVVRMINNDQVEQIMRLGFEYFADGWPFIDWLRKDFKILYGGPADASGCERAVRQLGTAERAGQVIIVLKQMRERKKKA